MRIKIRLNFQLFTVLDFLLQGQNTQPQQPKGRDLVRLIVSEDSVARGRNGMGESHGGGEMLNPFQPAGKEKRENLCTTMHPSRSWPYVSPPMRTCFLS